MKQMIRYVIQYTISEATARNEIVTNVVGDFRTEKSSLFVMNATEEHSNVLHSYASRALVSDTISQSVRR